MVKKRSSKSKSEDFRSNTSGGDSSCNSRTSRSEVKQWRDVQEVVALLTAAVADMTRPAAVAEIIAAAEVVVVVARVVVVVVVVVVVLVQQR